MTRNEIQEKVATIHSLIASAQSLTLIEKTSDAGLIMSMALEHAHDLNNELDAVNQGEGNYTLGGLG